MGDDVRAPLGEDEREAAVGEVGGLSERFWSKVAKGSGKGCWIWTGALTPDGYGQFYVDPERRQQRTHRLTYETLVGPIPPELVIDHLCRNRACCNPGHLEPVTIAENNRRGDCGLNLRNSETCRAGEHPWPESAFTRYDGFQGCRECTHARNRRSATGRIDCPICGVEIRRGNLWRHKRRLHSQLTLEDA